MVKLNFTDKTHLPPWMRLSHLKNVYGFILIHQKKHNLSPQQYKSGDPRGPIALKVFSKYSNIYFVLEPWRFSNIYFVNIKAEFNNILQYLLHIRAGFKNPIDTSKDVLPPPWIKIDIKKVPSLRKLKHLLIQFPMGIPQKYQQYPP